MSQAGILNVNGGGGASITFVTDSGSAIPSAGILNVNGAGGSSTSGSGNTIVITSTSDFQPNLIVQDFDDFIDVTTSSPGKWFWYNAGGPFQPSFATSLTHPGQAVFATVTSWLAPETSVLNGQWVKGGGALNVNWVVNLTALSDITNTYTTYIGLSSFAGNFVTIPNPPDSGIYFRYTDTVNSGKWQIVCNNAGTSTVVNTTVTADTSFHNFGIALNAAGTSVSFTIDGVTVGTAITTNIPTAELASLVYSIVSAGSLPAQAIDLFYYTLHLTVAR